jgi:hypothetical protein
MAKSGYSHRELMKILMPNNRFFSSSAQIFILDRSLTLTNWLDPYFSAFDMPQGGMISVLCHPILSLLGVLPRIIAPCQAPITLVQRWKRRSRHGNFVSQGEKDAGHGRTPTMATVTVTCPCNAFMHSR